jgi:O-methyltransferase
MIIRFTNRLLGILGYRLMPVSQLGADLTDLVHDRAFMEVLNKVRPYTMTSTERIHALYQAVKYVIDNKIPGDFVECGVWRGGSAMVMAYTSMMMGETSREIHLYDTFEGMSEPTENDKDVHGQKADSLLKRTKKVANTEDIWCYATMDDVRNNLASVAYPVDNIFFHKGKVEDTIPGFLPNQISLLRLDTDWYESTLHEMNHLYPLLSDKGVLILDDYGHWQGARKAVDEYMKKMGIKPCLHRIDYTGRIAIKN